MTIGASIFLMAVGAILTFALSDQKVGPVDLGTAGIILMIAGAFGAIIGGIMSQRARTSRSTSRRVVNGPGETPREEIVENEIR